MEVKKVTQGRDGCKVSGAYKLVWPIRKDYYHIRNDGSETVFASVFTDSTDTSEDGVYDIPSGGTLCIRSHGSDTLYVSGDVTVMGTASAVCPFKIGLRGGDGYDDVTATGNPVQLNGLQGGVPFSEITVSGKNLLKYPYMTESGKVTSGVIFTANSDGSITLNGTSTAYGSFNFTSRLTKDLLLNGTYTLSGATADAKLAINATRDGKATTIIRTRSSDTFIADYHDNDNEYGFAVFVEFDTGKTFDNLTIFPQIELGTTATDYEPPIIGREITLSACGKNIMHNGMTSTSGSPTITDNGDSWKIEWSDGVGLKFNDTVICPNTNYTFRYYQKSANAADAMRVMIINADTAATIYAQDVQDTESDINYCANTVTFNSGNASRIYVRFVRATTVGQIELLKAMQLEMGNVATPYEPYHGSTVTITPDSNPYAVPNDIRQQDGHNVVSVSNGTLNVTGCKSNMAVKRIWDKLDELATAIIVANGETE